MLAVTPQAVWPPAAKTSPLTLRPEEKARGRERAVLLR